MGLLTQNTRMIGPSPVMNALRIRLHRFGRSDLPVLIQGETGSGKELAARELHHASGRRSHPFVAVNCGAIPRALVEAELFGSEPGGFTGAKKKTGWFSRAHNGTLFLDEIGDLPLGAQAVLLRVLETGLVWPVGGEQPKNVSIRLICATHHPLARMVEQKLFRRDLYHRLSVLIVRVPPLRTRTEDLPFLCENLCGLAAQRIEPDAWRGLEQYSFPGNVRELRNILERAEIEADGGPIRLRHLSLPQIRPNSTQNAQGHHLTLQQQLANYVKNALRQHDGNVRATARTLAVSPTTVYRYLAYGGHEAQETSYGGHNQFKSQPMN